MSSNGEQPKIQITCVCGQTFSAPVPNMEIVNTVKASLIVATHEKPVRCICRQAYLPVMAAAQVQWGVQPVSDEQLPAEESRIVKPDIRLLGRS